MIESREGQVITFYSYKGGTGRTMALANVAWILASAGNRVLVADWDLEAPGLPKFFRLFLDQDTLDDAKGVIDLIREYEDQVGQDAVRPDNWVQQLARVDRYANSVKWEFEGGGLLNLLSAGRQNGAYASSLSSLDWDTFYDRLNGAHFLDALREDMRSRYDYTLIDSRTGLSDVADICTQHLPDALVDCFTLSDQGIDGAARVARLVAPYTAPDSPSRRVRVLPVAMRVDLAEKEKVDAGRMLALRSFPGLPSGLGPAERAAYFASVEVPYQPFYAYEETLAVFGDNPGSPTSLLAAYERLTDVITHGQVTSLTPMDEALRSLWKDKFQRRLRPEPSELVLTYAADDRIWAEWITETLGTAGVTVTQERGPALAIVSERYLAIGRGTIEDADRSGQVQFAVHIDNSRLTDFTAKTTNVVGLSEEQATASLLRLIGRGDQRALSEKPPIARYPGEEPTWLRLPARNLRFTGRIGDLQRLRDELRADGRAVLLPVALQGMGGIGKTQLALEYAHRFKAAYDVVWWIPTDPSDRVEQFLSDLGVVMGLPVERTTAETARATFEALRRGTVTRRWLLIFDNADDVAEVQKFLPQGAGGHVLITSRNSAWKDHAKPIEVDVFQREESIAHLRERAEAMTEQQADQLAQALGDLPIAVAAAGAWLAETGTSIEEYLREIESHGTSGQAVQATWDLSLDRLRQRSPGGYRLLQLCSVMAPETSVDLLNSDQMAAALLPFDPSVSERVMRGAPLQQINRLALLKLDTHDRQVQVHRLLQDAVRQRMTADELSRVRHEVHLALAKFRPNGDADDPKNWPSFRMIWPHLEISGAVLCPDESVRQLMIDRVRYLWRTGDLQRGLDFGETVAAAWAAQLSPGTDDEVSADTIRRQLLHLRFNMANILRDQAQFGAALNLDQENLEAQSRLLGGGHPHTLMTSGGLAADLRALGRYAEALPLEEQTYRTWLDAFGEDNHRTLSAANNLAASLRAVGDFRRATTIDEEVIERRRNELGPFHPYTLHSRLCLGRDLREAGEYEQSLSLLRNVFELSKEHLGPDALGTLNAQANLAASLRCAGRAVEGAYLLDNAFETLNGRFGPANPHTMACRLNRSANLLALGDITRALDEMIAVTASYQDALGAEHPFTLVCVNNQSAALRALERWESAQDLAQRAVTGFVDGLGGSHPYSLAAGMNLATGRHHAGDVASAAQLMTELEVKMTWVWGAQHPDVLACRANLGLIKSDSRAGHDPVAAAAEVVSVVNALSQQLGETHPSVRSLRAERLLYLVIDPHDPY